MKTWYTARGRRRQPEASHTRLPVFTQHRSHTAPLRAIAPLMRIGLADRLPSSHLEYSSQSLSLPPELSGSIRPSRRVVLASVCLRALRRNTSNDPESNVSPWWRVLDRLCKYSPSCPTNIAAEAERRPSYPSFIKCDSADWSF